MGSDGVLDETKRSFTWCLCPIIACSEVTFVGDCYTGVVVDYEMFLRLLPYASSSRE